MGVLLAIPGSLYCAGQGCTVQVTKEDLAVHIRQRLEAEHSEKEKQRKEKEESHLYTVIRVARDKDIKEQVGKDNFFDLVDHDKVVTTHLTDSHILVSPLFAMHHSGNRSGS